MISFLRHISLAIFTLILSTASLVATADISVGLGGGWQSSPYKGHDNMILPVPLINFEGEQFYVRDLDAGVHIWRNENHAISLGASIFALAFDSSKTHDRSLKKLDDRNSTVNTYLQYSLQTDYGLAGVRVLHDALGNSNAFSAEAYYKYPLMFGPVYVSSGAGIRWESKDQLDYYFGISSREARKSGLSKYTPHGGVSPFISLEADWRFADNWSVISVWQVSLLSKQIKNSPMVDDSRIFNVIIGLKYIF